MSNFSSVRLHSSALNAEALKADDETNLAHEDVALWYDFNQLTYTNYEGPQEPSEVNKSLLKRAIDDAESQDTTGATDTAVAAFQKALAEAKAVYENPDATQDEVNTAVDKLDAAIRDLTTQSGETPNATDKPEATDEPEGEGSVQTGHSANVVVWTIMAGGCVVALIGALIVGKIITRKGRREA